MPDPPPLRRYPTAQGETSKVALPARKILAEFVTVTGRRNADGDVYACNDPVFVKKARFNLSTTTGAKIFMAQIETFLSIPVAELKDYSVLITGIRADNSGDAVLSDTVSVYVAITTTERDIVIGSLSFTALMSMTPILVHLSETRTRLYFDFDSWGAAETHNGTIDVMIYRMPSVICDAETAKSS